MDAATLGTDRLTLCVASDADLPLRDRTRTDPVIRRYLGGPLPRETLARWRAERANATTFVARRRSDDEPVGVCALAPYRDDVELSYMFVPEHWGHGYATEACLVVLEWGFAAQPELCRIIAVTQSANVQSHRLLQRLGMTPRSIPTSNGTRRRPSSPYLAQWARTTLPVGDLAHRGSTRRARATFTVVSMPTWSGSTARA